MCVHNKLGCIVSRAGELYAYMYIRYPVGLHIMRFQFEMEAELMKECLHAVQ